MDQPTPEPSPAPVSPAPEPAPVPPVPAPDAAAAAVATPLESRRAWGREDRIAHRLQARIETTEPVIAWTQGWVSREMRLHGVFAARTLDFAVLTEHWFFLLSTGFFTRRPRRCVYAVRLADAFVSRTEIARNERLRIASPRGRPLWLELKTTERTTAFVVELLAHSRRPPGTDTA
jgi:hypothetical protein